MSATVSPAPGAVLVATKLHVPAVRAGAVSRRELIERLSGRGGGKLVLLCAPAGWGKTTLVSEWCASEPEGRRFAWVSLDASDKRYRRGGRRERTAITSAPTMRIADATPTTTQKVASFRGSPAG